MAVPSAQDWTPPHWNGRVTATKSLPAVTASEVVGRVKAIVISVEALRLLLDRVREVISIGSLPIHEPEVPSATVTNSETWLLVDQKVELARPTPKF